MADQVQIKWLYPPNFEGTFAAGTKNGPRRYIVQLICFSDGTGEEDEIKVRRTDLITSAGNVPSQLVVEKIEYDVSGMNVMLEWSNTNTDEKIAIMNDSHPAGVFDFTKFGGLIVNDENVGDDPNWGDIILNSTSGASDFSDPEEFQQPSFGDSYNIILTVRAKD